MTGYVVIGMAGEHSEIHEWIVRGWIGGDAKQVAEEFARDLNTEVHERNKSWWEGAEEAWKKPLAKDPDNHQEYADWEKTLDYQALAIPMETL